MKCPCIIFRPTSARQAYHILHIIATLPNITRVLITGQCSTPHYSSFDSSQKPDEVEDTLHQIFVYRELLPDGSLLVGDKQEDRCCQELLADDRFVPCSRTKKPYVVDPLPASAACMLFASLQQSGISRNLWFGDDKGQKHCLFGQDHGMGNRQLFYANVATLLLPRGRRKPS